MMNARPVPSSGSVYAVKRLASLAPLTADDLSILQDATNRLQSVAPRRDVVASGSPTPAALLIVDGWAFRSCLMADGRRQIIQMLLPGDVIQRLPAGCTQPQSVTALTAVTYCSLSDPRSHADSSGLEKALAVSQATDVDYLYRQIARLGRLSALERVADWLLEIHDRLEQANQCVGDTFALPLTQETVADVLGLTSVHVNRTLMALRRDDLVRVGGGRATIIDRSGCELLIGNR